MRSFKCPGCHMVSEIDFYSTGTCSFECFTMTMDKDKKAVFDEVRALRQTVETLVPSLRRYTSATELTDRLKKVLLQIADVLPEDC